MSDRTPNLVVCAACPAGVALTPFILNYPFNVKYFVTSHMDEDKYESVIAQSCKDAGVEVVRKQDVNEESFVERLRKDKIDLVLLVWWPAIVKPHAINAVTHGWINMHPSLLPYNRGKHPYYWAIVEGTRFGTSLHYITAGIDDGPVLFQKEIPVTAEDTGGSLYKKAYDASLDLFRQSYPDIVTLNYEAQPQNDAAATFHWAKQLAPHSTIDLAKNYEARDLINRIRARTFNEGPSSTITIDGKDYYVRLTLEEKRD